MPVPSFWQSRPPLGLIGIVGFVAPLMLHLTGDALLVLAQTLRAGRHLPPLHHRPRFGRIDEMPVELLSLDPQAAFLRAFRQLLGLQQPVEGTAWLEVT